MNALVIVWFGTAVAGALAVVVALFFRNLRSQALLVAGVSFAIAGVLGILSIGVLFIGLSALCFSRRRTQVAVSEVGDPIATATVPEH